MRKCLGIAIIFSLFLLITGCGVGSKNANEEDIKDLVHQYSVGHVDNVSASVTSHELIVT